MFLGSRLEESCDRLPYRLVRIVSHVRMRLVEAFNHFLHSLVRSEVTHLRLRSRGLRPKAKDRFAHSHALPVAPVDLVIPPFSFRAAGYILGGLRNQPLCKVHHALVIGVSLVELEHGELGIPAPAESFI